MKKTISIIAIFATFFWQPSACFAAAIELYSTPLFSDANLVAYYRLEDTSDSKGSYTLTNVNSVTFDASKFNNGANFGNPNTTKSLEVANNMGITASTHFTYSGWIQNASEITSSYRMFFGLYNHLNAAAGGVFYQIYYENGANDHLSFYRLDSGGWNGFTYNINLTNDAWYHIALTYDGSALIGYVNGSEVGRDSSLGGGVDVSPYAENINFGRERLSGSNWVGRMDDIAIFNRDLTATEISDLYSGNYASGTVAPLSSSSFWFNLLDN